MVFLHYLVFLSYENSWLYILYIVCEPCNERFVFISGFLNKVTANTLPFKASLKEEVEFVNLIFVIGYVMLIWQVIADLKIHTRKH